MGRVTSASAGALVAAASWFPAADGRETGRSAGPRPRGDGFPAFRPRGDGLAVSVPAGTGWRSRISGTTWICTW